MPPNGRRTAGALVELLATEELPPIVVDELVAVEVPIVLLLPIAVPIAGLVCPIAELVPSVPNRGGIAGFICIVFIMPG